MFLLEEVKKTEKGNEEGEVVEHNVRHFFNSFLVAGICKQYR
jgi:hypothetical protein